MNRKNLLPLLLGLFIFHVGVSTLFYGISIHGYFSTLNNGKGIWNYAKDSNGYHKEALKNLNMFQKEGVVKWWKLKPKYWHVKYIAFMYDVFKPVPLAMAPLNALIWTFSFLLVFSISGFLLGNHFGALIAALVFSFFPSNLLDSIQLLQDPFYIFGVLLFLRGWIWVWQETHRQKKNFLIVILPIICVGVGFYILVEIRFYLLMVWAGMALLFYVFSLARRPGRWVVSTLMIFAVLFVFFLVKPVKPVKRVIKYPWHFSWWIPDKIEFRLIKLARYRKGFCTCCPHAGSNIDTSVRFHSAKDIVRYLPRAIEIGFLAPFPNLRWTPLSRQFLSENKV